MRPDLDRLAQGMTTRKTLLWVILILVAIAINQSLQENLRTQLEQKEKEYAQSRALLESKDALKDRQKDLDLFSTYHSAEQETGNWSEAIPPLVSARHLILRQRRPLGVERKGKVKQDKILIQVDGSVEGFLGLLYDLASAEKTVYVSRFFVTSEIVGSGFVTAEMVITRLVVE